MQITWHDRSPIYRQLSERLREMILDGVFTSGDALPSVRQIASEARINPITVSKAYQMLVDDELVEKRRGLGMYVSLGAREQLMEDERQVFIQYEWPEFKERADRLGISISGLVNESQEVAADSNGSKADE